MSTLPPAIMLQGTSSSAGKTLLTAALCRYYRQQGLAVFPFKAQNMTSNVCTLENGDCMSGAQVLQAMAAGVRPEPAMNPVLLKPLTDMRSELMVMGTSRGAMAFGEYTRRRNPLFRQVREAYLSLAARADLMILEGAGSPAEINLRQHDIVNMRMAHTAAAKVLLVGDIDRGGVFAHLFGTYKLLPPKDRKCIAGFILNKFRGDPALLGDAEAHITRRTGVPFLATVPFLPEAACLPEEDSLGSATPASLPFCETVPHSPLDPPPFDAVFDALAAAVAAAFSGETLEKLAALR